MLRFQNKNPPACSSQSPPNYTDEDFPQLNKDPLEFREQPFKRFLVIKHTDTTIKMSDLNPFEVDKKLKTVIGKKHTCI